VPGIGRIGPIAEPGVIMGVRRWDPGPPPYT
jgi:hypothetical protein